MFLYGQWLKLPIATRHKIAAAFDIKKTGATEVFNNDVIKDGYIIGDIESFLNVDALQKYLNTHETDMAVLWEMLVAKTEGREMPKVEITPELDVRVEPQDPEVVVEDLPKASFNDKAVDNGTSSIQEAEQPKKKRGRPYKNGHEKG